MRRDLELDADGLELRHRVARNVLDDERDLLSDQDLGLAVVHRRDARVRDDVGLAMLLENLKLGLQEDPVLENAVGDAGGGIRDRGVVLAAQDVIVGTERMERHLASRLEEFRLRRPHVPLDPEVAQRLGLHVHQLGGDLDLRRGGVEVRGHLLDLRAVLLEVAHDQRIGAPLDLDRAAPRERGLQRHRELACVRVVELDDARVERPQLHGLGARGLAVHALGLELVEIVHPEDPALLDVVESVAAQNRAERVLPPHVLERHLDDALHVLTHHDVAPAELRDRAHDRADVGAFHVDAEGARARSDQAHLLHGAVLRRGGGGCDRHEPRAGQHNEPHLDLTESHWTYLPSASMEWLPIESVRPP